MQEYCLGFCIHKDEVLLIRKQRPAWQKGLLNGVGGHVEQGEQPLDAMAREFQEETGLIFPSKSWKKVVFYRGKDWQMHVYVNDSCFDGAESKTDELLEVHHIHTIAERICLPNLRWLIPLCLQQGLQLPITITEKDAA